MAPIKPANMTSTVENEGCMIPFPTVSATAVPKMKGPAKLATAAIPTAYSGLSLESYYRCNSVTSHENHLQNQRRGRPK